MPLFDTVYPSQNPADTEGVKLGASRIRELKDDLQVLLTQLFNDDTTLKDAAINTAQLVAKAVTLAKMADGARGSVIVFNSSSRPVLLPVGTAGQILGTVDGLDVAWTTQTIVEPANLAPESSNVGANATVLSNTLQKIGSCTLTLPAGKTWRWVKVVFATYLGSFCNIGAFEVRIATDVLTLNQSMPTGYFISTNNSDDAMQVTYTAEGSPAGHTADASLVVDIYAANTAGYGGDTVAARSFYVLGYAA